MAHCLYSISLAGRQDTAVSKLYPSYIRVISAITCRGSINCARARVSARLGILGPGAGGRVTSPVRLRPFRGAHGCMMPGALGTRGGIAGPHARHACIHSVTRGADGRAH